MKCLPFVRDSSVTRDEAKLPPLFFGRLMRISTGLVTLGVIPFVGIDQLGLWGVAGLGFLGFLGFLPLETFTLKTSC